MIEHYSELPMHIIGAEDVYLDFETTSGNPKLDSLFTWKNCGVAGIAFSADKNVYYIPYMHWCIEDRNTACDFIWALLVNCKRWINHNIKYDMHVAQNACWLPIELLTCQFVCTLTLSKLIDSDRGFGRGGYGLDALSKQWCKYDIDKYGARLRPYLYNAKGHIINRDYGRIPADILGEYACEDIVANKLVMLYIAHHLPDQCIGVMTTEIMLTRNLFILENNGLYIDQNECKLTQYKSLKRRINIEEQLEQLVGRPFCPTSTDQCFDVFCNQYGLPILAYTKDEDGNPTNNPSFDKHALELYAAHPLAPAGVVDLVKEYRKLETLDNLFLKVFQELHINSVLHSDYNQTVRTGRMSCSMPNAQQNSSTSKKLIHPKPGYVFVSIDYSQIEFRTIIHYIEDESAIAAFKLNPDMDFHQWLADEIGISRRAAKTLNFGIAFGLGKGKLTRSLSIDTSLVGPLLDYVDSLVIEGKVKDSERLEVFNKLSAQKAEDTYNAWHAKFPNCKPIAKLIERVCKSRGYVFTLAGRHRHLPAEFAYRAFNTVNQGSAADIMKNRANALAEMLVGTPIEMVAIVHDEFLFQVPITDEENMKRTIRDLVIVMEDNPFEMAVPIRCSAGYSSENWSAAGKSIAEGGNGGPVMYEKSDFNNLNQWRTTAS